ncbi:hypothetical protein J437_LFUL017519 [Ladona fulva]|uniref:Endonuclease/exonuclease/phosphatase domain-containing protein n=1 Tax=Ladona fulva TaxID=123851 RepID=A0A8K0KP42_LADFU|nr:hypothetical protein J437_LFUL017519 [Ladona fulva]
MTREIIEVLHWNANGIKRQELEFHNVLINHDIAVALVCETHLTPDMNFNLPATGIKISDCDGLVNLLSIYYPLNRDPIPSDFNSIHK